VIWFTGETTTTKLFAVVARLFDFPGPRLIGET